MRSLIDILDFSVEELDQLIAVAKDIAAHPEKYWDKCAHKKLATLFFEPSTRTRLSFEAAMPISLLCDIPRRALPMWHPRLRPFL